MGGARDCLGAGPVDSRVHVKWYLDMEGGVGYLVQCSHAVQDRQ